jgi:hypothetical protein
MTSLFFAEPPQSGVYIHINSASAVLDILDHVVQESEWPSVADLNSSPIPGRSPSFIGPPLRWKSPQILESGQSIKRKT